jgi:subtilisin family serine protease
MLIAQNGGTPFEAKKAKAKISTQAKTDKKADTFIVKFKSTLSESDKQEIASTYNVTFVNTKVVANMYVVKPHNDEKLALLRNDSRVLIAEYNNEVKVQVQSTDWGVTKTHGEYAWPYSTGTDVVVAVIDSGIQLDHPDLVANIQAGGYDYINDDAIPEDQLASSHGTHVSGIIAGVDNTDGYVGLAKGAKILPMKVFNSLGSTTELAISNAIIDATDQGADIINMSLGGTEQSLTIADAVAYAYENGVVVIAAAGNGADTNGDTYADSDLPSCMYPAAEPGAICVGSINSVDIRQFPSNYGVDIAAPGVGITSTITGSTYGTLTGTSMATPYVSAAAAILKSYDPTLTPDQVAALLMYSARDIGTAGPDVYFGYGALDLQPLFVTLGISVDSFTAELELGKTYTHSFSLNNTNDFDVNVTSCYIHAVNRSRVSTQTQPAIVVQSLQQDTNTYTNITNSQTTVGIMVDPEVSLPTVTSKQFTLTYKANTAAVFKGETVELEAMCMFDVASTPEVEELYSLITPVQSAQASLSAVIAPVYFTFWTIRYGNYASPTKLRSGDNISLKNYNASKVQLLSISLYDYTTKKNQCYTRTWKSSTQIYMKTCANLPTGRKYAFIFKFKEKATGVVKTMYFVVNTIRPGVVTY